MPKYEPTYAAFEGDAPSPKVTNLDSGQPVSSYTLTKSNFELHYDVEGLPFEVPFGSTRCCPSRATVHVEIVDSRPRWTGMDVRGLRANKHGLPTSIASTARFAPYCSEKMPDYLGDVVMAAERRVRNWIEGNC